MGKTVLFGDDEQHELMPLKATIEARGYRVLEAVSISEVLGLLKKETIDVLVLDIMMDPGKELESKLDPHIAGVQALDLIRETSPRTQIICLSVKSDKQTEKYVKKRGALFLAKGETSLRKASSLIESKLTGIIRDSDLRRRSHWTK